MSERSLSYEMFRGVNHGGSLFLSDWSRERFWFLLPFGSRWPLMVGLPLWAVIITVWEASQILSSSVEYLSARLYKFSIIVSESRDSKWKNGVVGPKLLRKFWRTASILYESICWTTPLNLLVKSRMDSSSPLKMVCRELMFPFYRTEHKY